MRKIFTFFAAALMSASMFAGVIDLTLEEAPYLFQSGNELCVYLTSDDEVYNIALYINNITEMANGVEYKWADMDQYGCYVVNNNTYHTAKLTSASITWTQDAEGLDRYEGYAYAQDGNQYNFLYQEKAFAPTGDTIPVSFPNVGAFEFNRWRQCWTVYCKDKSGSDISYTVEFSLLNENTESPVGQYTEENFLAESTNSIKVQKDGKTKEYNFLEADITITYWSDSTVLNALALAEDGNVYDIFIYYSDPKPLYQKKLRLYNLVKDESNLEWNMIDFSASNDDWNLKVRLTIEPGDDYHSIYILSEDEISVTLRDQQEREPNIFSGEISINEGEEGDEISGWVLCWGDTMYALDLRTVAPPVYTLELLVNDPELGSVTLLDQYHEYTPNEDGTYSIYEGDVLVMQAIPAAGCTFLGWSVGEGDSEYLYYTMTADATITATFEGASEGIDRVQRPDRFTDSVQKVLRNGQLIILRDGKIYNAQGAEVR